MPTSSRVYIYIISDLLVHFIPKIINAKSTATVFKVPKNEGEKKTLIMLFMLHVQGAAAEPMFGRSSSIFSLLDAITPKH